MNFASFSQDLFLRRSQRAAGLVVVELIDSTQVLARRIVDEYVREGSKAPEVDVVAWSQSAGRGRRRGRSWSSPAGAGVYATMIRWRDQRDWLLTLPLQAAVALCEKVNDYVGGRCRLKWPNDLLLDGEKLGGLLIDAVTYGEAAPIAIVSFGVNLHAEAVSAAGTGSTSIAGSAGTGEAPTLSQLTVELLGAVHEEMASDVSTSLILERYQELSSHEPGDVLRCLVGDGDTLEGRFLGFDEHGFLRLDVAGEERLVSTGEILDGG